MADTTITISDHSFVKLDSSTNQNCTPTNTMLVHDDDSLKEEPTDHTVMLDFENQLLRRELSKLSSQVVQLKQQCSSFTSTVKAKYERLGTNKTAIVATVAAAAITVPLFL